MKNLFLSVPNSPTTGTTGLTITFTAVNNPFLTGSFSVAITGLMSTDTPAVVAMKIYQALQTKFAEDSALLTYGGTAPFLLEQIPFTFRAYICEHVVNVWSQCQFSVAISSDTSGTNIVAAETPVFPLLTEAKDIAAVKGVNFVDQNGDDLTDAQIIKAMTLSSAQICAWLRGFNVVLSTYLHSETGQWWKGFPLRFNPVEFWDPINARGPFISNYAGAYGAAVIQRFDVDSYTGVVEMLDFSESLQIREIGDFGNQIHMTYAAGYSHVPDVLKAETVRVLGLSKEPLSILSLKGGRGEIVFRDQKDAMREILYNLQEFAP